MDFKHPLANRSFLSLFESSGSVGKNTGWLPRHFEINQSLLASYIKFHSYGEYIFDWSWADFYDQNKISYYPKLLHAIPFSPVNAPKFIGNETDFEQLAEISFDFYQNSNISSEHFLFINDQEEKLLKPLGFKTLLTHQYHFQNEYESFTHFLDSLRKNKRKNIKKERKSILESDLIIRRYTGVDLTDALLEEFYPFYLSTIDKKRSYAYLTKDFFTSLNKDSTLLIAAILEDQVVAMSLFFYGVEALYGRLWGIDPKFEGQFPFLHFELCYYQGIEYCIENKLKLFEAGAQGEHKLTRGFKPVIIKSAHHIKIPQCFDIIKQDIERQNRQTSENIKFLEPYLPFK